MKSHSRSCISRAASTSLTTYGGSDREVFFDKATMLFCEYMEMKNAIGGEIQRPSS